jgi:hypothetical protein
MAKELSREFPYPRDQVWAALPAALSSAKMSVDGSDSRSGTMKASTGISLSSWVEKVEVQVQELGSGNTNVTVTSGVKFGLTGGGKLKRNINRVFDSLDAALR